MKRIPPLKQLRSTGLSRFEASGLLWEKRFSSSEVGIDKKVLSYWRTKGLVSFMDKGSWTEASFIDLIWLRILDTLRKFGYSVNQMQKLYHYLFTRAFEENLAEKNLQAVIQLYEEKIKAGDNSNETISLHELAVKNINDKLLRAALRTDISYLSVLIIGSLTEGYETGIIITENDEFCLYGSLVLNQEEADTIAFYRSQPHIFIPISHYISSFLSEEDKHSFIIYAGILDEDELRIIREIRQQNLKSITISFDEKTGKPIKIESDMSGLIQGEKARQVMKILGLKNYTGIELNTRDGRTLSFKKTEKHVLKK